LPFGDLVEHELDEVLGAVGDDDILDRWCGVFSGPAGLAGRDAIASPARKMVRIAPTPGAAMLIPISPAAMSAILSPIEAVVSPAACTIPRHSWSTTSSSSAVNVITTNDPNTDLASPNAARASAVGSRRTRPVRSWRQKKISITKTATPNNRL
jgi:hypothetical protein